MNVDFVIYELHRTLWVQSYSEWLRELGTLRYWGMVTFIALYYATWWQLTDKRRISDLLLYGSLMAVLQVIIDIFGVTAGLWYYRVHIVPFSISIFILGLTIIPLTYMLVQQHSPDWKRFFILNAIGTGFVFFLVMPLLAAVGVFQLMKWNYPFSYLTMFLAASFSRLAFHLVKQVQAKAVEGEIYPLQEVLLHPAFKPLSEEKDPSSDKRP